MEYLLSCEEHRCIYHQLKTSFEKFCASICLLTIIMICLKMPSADIQRSFKFKERLNWRTCNNQLKTIWAGQKNPRTLRWHLKVYFALWISSLLTLPFSSMPVITLSPVPLLSTLSLSSPADHNAAPLLDIKCFFFWDYLPISVVEVLFTAS